MSIESMMKSSHLILGRPFLLLPPIPPSIKVFSNESTFLMRWPKYWSFNFSIIPSKEIPWLISFRMDWLDLLAVQGTLKNLLQHHSSHKLMAPGGRKYDTRTRWPCWNLGSTGLTSGSSLSPLHPCWKPGQLAMFSRKSEVWIFMYNVLILN